MHSNGEISEGKSKERNKKKKSARIKLGRKINYNLFRFLLKKKKFQKKIIKMEGDDVVSHNKKVISLWETTKLCSKVCKTVKFEENLSDDDRSCLSTN